MAWIGRALGGLLFALLMLPAWSEEPRTALPKPAWSQLEKTALALAGAARGGELEDLLDVMRELGRSSEDIAKLRKRATKALKRGKRKARGDQRAAKALAKAVARLVPVLPQVAEASRIHFARLLLRLDDRIEPAHVAAGDVEREGAWVLSWMPPLLDRRREIEAAVRAARKLDVPIQTGPSAHPLFRSLYAKDGMQARWKHISIHSVNLSADRLERILRQTLRAFALSNFLRNGPLAIPGGTGTYRGLNLGSRADYRRAIGFAVATGGLAAGEAEAARGQAWIRHAREGYVVTGYQTEAGIESSLLDDLLGDTGFGSSQPCLYVGHLNWVCQTLLGTWAPGWVYDESKIKAERASRTGSPVERKEREEAELVAQAGLAGSRTYLRYLVRHGEDPPWRDTMLDQHGKIGGELRLKATVVAEFLQERRDLHTLASDTRSSGRGVAEAFVQALGEPLPKFERRWRRWLLPPNASIARRLRTADSKAEALPAPTRKMLVYLHGLRMRATEVTDEKFLSPLTLDAELSGGCEAHARYLDKNPEQKSQWPQAHEEFPDKDGFSPQGSLGGLNSVIAFGKDTPSEFVDQWLGTFYHRLPLLDPGLRRIGWAHAAQVAVLDCASMVAPTAYQLQARWPHADQTGVPRSFQPELPNPVPGADQAAWGYPVSVQIFTSDWELKALRMQLFRGAPRASNEVACHFSTPDRPTNPELAPSETWCLIPKHTLAAKQRYTVVVKGIPQKPSWTWVFTTGP